MGQKNLRARLQSPSVNSFSVPLVFGGPIVKWKRRVPYDASADPTVAEKFERVRKELPLGQLGGSEFGTAVITEVRRSGDAALVIFEWTDEHKPIALKIDLRDTSREFYYDEPVASFEEWIEYLGVYVIASFDTGVVHRAKRIDRGDYDELVGT
jgi:hypothetical protein